MLRLKVKVYSVRAQAAAVILAASLLSVGPAAAAESPVDFPSWEEVRDAKGNEAATKSQVAELDSLLAGLRATAADQGDDAVEAAARSAAANAALVGGERAVAELEGRLVQAELVAGRKLRQVGEAAAHFYKTGQSSDGGLLIFASPGRALEVLDGMATLQVVAEGNSASYQDAREAQSRAEALRAQHESATKELSVLAKAAQDGELLATEAAETANQAVQTHEVDSEVLIEQLAELNNTTVELESRRQRGLQEERAFAQQQEQARLAALQEAAERNTVGAVPEAPIPQSPPAGAPAGPPAQPSPVPPSTNQPAPAPVVPPVIPPAEPSPSPPPTQPPPAQPQPIKPPPPVQPPPPPPPVTQPPPPVVPVDDPAGAQAYASSRMGGFGWNEDQFQCLVNLWNRESGWRTSANNPYSGAYGIPQSLPGSKMGSAGADWRTNYRTQIEWGLGYIAGRYGTPCAAWDHSERNGWY